MHAQRRRVAPWELWAGVDVEADRGDVLDFWTGEGAEDARVRHLHPHLAACIDGNGWTVNAEGSDPFMAMLLV